MVRPAASLSLDLDNYWAYLKTHGNPAWETYPSYLATVVPRALAFLRERGLRVTVFVVGRDALRPEHRGVLSSISSAGHEIGNHSHTHEPWLHRYPPDQVDQELRAAHEAIEEAPGGRPRGFRGPGFSISEGVLETLIDLGYRYDASTLPTFIGPIARAYYFRASKLDAEERRRREAPAALYLRFALRLCLITGVRPSLLLHPLDFLGPDEAPGLEFFPGMGTEAEVKWRRLDRFVNPGPARPVPGAVGGEG